MAITVPTKSANRFLAHMLNAERAENLVLRLYANDVLPSAESVVEDFLEANGYTPQLLTGSDWAIEDGIATAGPRAFAFRAFRGTVHGYYVTQVLEGGLMWSERFSDGPYTIQNDGDSITVSPSISLA